VRVAALFAAVTLLGIGLASFLIYQEQKQELEETLGALLVGIARTAALLIDPALHADVEATMTRESEAYRRLRATLAAIQDENRVETPIYTLTGFDAEARHARFMVTSRGPGTPGVLDPLARAFRDGVATSTRIYQNQSGTWITAFAPVRDARGRVLAVLDVDYRVDVYLARVAGLRHTVLGASVVAGLLAVLAGLLFARRLTGPLSALTEEATHVAGGDLSRSLPVRSRDEVGQLTRAFNDMLAGLRQRDFIRDTFGRYVSPEVARELLESPGGLRLGGEKRDVTILMCDLRGYTRFAEVADPAEVMQLLNTFLGRLTEIVAAHEGTVNEFMGDGIFAIFGAPRAHPDHPERAAACALVMQRTADEINCAHDARGLPALELGIGLNSGDAIVGNIGSERRAKYGVVGSVVNLTARVEACTVGGQILLSPYTYERIRGIAEVGPPLTVELKGLREPLRLYELRALGGRYAQRLPAARQDAEPEVTTSMPLRCWVIEGKVVRPDSIGGEVRRLGRHRLEARLDHRLPPMTEVRLRLSYARLGRDSADLYGKVLATTEEAGFWIARVGLTSVDAADQEVLDSLLQAERSAGAG
jgi:sigma-B regulation protein RsbU (phosphoserine phosphatase)